VPLPDGRPVLSIAQKIIVAWPAAATNHVLEVADTMPASEWQRVTNTPVSMEGCTAVILDCRDAKKFFRMPPMP